jgi:hypothetical protein
MNATPPFCCAGGDSGVLTSGSGIDFGGGSTFGLLRDFEHSLADDGETSGAGIAIRQLRDSLPSRSLEALLCLTDVVGLRGGSTVGLSAQGLANVAGTDSFGEFTFVVANRHYRCRSSVAHFLSPLVSRLHSLDATIDLVRLDVADPGGLFGAVLDAASGAGVPFDSANQSTLLALCKSLWNSELYESVCANNVTVENVINRLGFLSKNGCGISTELEFVALHFSELSHALDDLPFAIIYEIIRYPSLLLESEDCLYNFICRGNETNPEFFALLELVRFEYCSPDTMHNFFLCLSEHIEKFNRSMWDAVRARLVLANITFKKFPPSSKKKKNMDFSGRKHELDIPDGIIAHLTRECGGNVHHQGIVEVTSSNVHVNDSRFAGEKAVDLDTDSHFASNVRWGADEVVDTMYDWLCYDFKKRSIVPSHYTIRSNYGEPGGWHLKLWVVEISEDGDTGRELDPRKTTPKSTALTLLESSPLNRPDLVGPSGFATHR